MRWLSCHETSGRAALQSPLAKTWRDWSERDFSLSPYLIDYTGRVHLLL
jgi:hypothetical protein